MLQFKKRPENRALRARLPIGKNKGQIQKQDLRKPLRNRPRPEDHHRGRFPVAQYAHGYH